MLLDLSFFKRLICLIILVYCFWFVEFNDPFTTDPTIISLTFNDTVKPSRFLIMPKMDKCKKNPPRLVAMVISSVSNLQQREVVRSTWASSKHSKAIRDGKALVYFIVSKPKNMKMLEQIKAEDRKYSDIVMIDLEESYDNLVLKVYSSILFSTRFCDQAGFHMKVDDDVVVHVDRLFHYLIDSVSMRNQLICKVWDYSLPVRKTKSKWYVPKEDWPHRKFPKYCNGPMYIIGMKAAAKILDAVQVTDFLKLEDVLFTGIAAKTAKINHVYWGTHIRAHSEEMWWGLDECDRKKEPLMLSVHSLSTTEKMKQGHNVLRNLNCSSRAKIDERRKEEFNKKKKH